MAFRRISINSVGVKQASWSQCNWLLGNKKWSFLPSKLCPQAIALNLFALSKDKAHLLRQFQVRVWLVIFAFQTRGLINCVSSKPFSGRHSVGYEITFFAVKPAPIATSPITKIHLVLSLARRFLIELEGQNLRACAHHRHKHFYKSNYLVACLQINPTSKDITIKGKSAFKIPINTNTPIDIAR